MFNNKLLALTIVHYLSFKQVGRDKILDNIRRLPSRPRDKRVESLIFDSTDYSTNPRW